MSKLIAKIAAYKVITALVAVVVVAGGTAGGVVLNGGNNGNTCNGSCITSVPPGQQSGRTAPPTSTRTASVCPVPGDHPKFIAIMMQGIGSYVQSNPLDDNSGDLATFNPAKISYCATSPSYGYPKGDPFVPPPGNGSLPPNNPNIVLRSMADGWLNYGIKFSGGHYFPTQPETDQSTVYPGKGEDLINDLADAGGYVLPFSYWAPSNGPPYPPFAAAMSGTAVNPKFQFYSYNNTDVAAGDPQLGNPPVLNFEIASIDKVFPNVPIIIIGHSNGGLIAEQWWLRFGTKMPCGDISGLPGQPQCGMKGVAHIFTLDSPINGVSQADLCDNGFDPDLGGYVAGQAVNLLCSSSIGTTEAGEYSGMYQGNVSDMVPGLTTSPPDPGEGDPLIAFLDTSYKQFPKLPPGAPSQLSQLIPQGFHTQPGTFTAVGTYGDPLFDAGDSFVAAQHLGILSQVVFSLDCLRSPDLTASECAPPKGIESSTVPPLDFVSSCAGSYDPPSKTSYSNEADGNPGPTNYPVYFGGIGNLPNPSIPIVSLIQTYGIPGSLYIHSQAKNCPSTVNMIVNYVKTGLPKSAPPPVGTCVVPPANAVAAWKATANEAGNLVSASLRQIAGELSCPVRIAELNQLATLPLSELDEGTPQQQAEGNADIKALDNYFGTPGLFPGTGSNTGTTPTPPPTTSPPTTPPPTLVTPGNGSPGDAVDGFYQGELAGDWAAVCSYVTPSAQTLCLAGTSGQPAATGKVTVGQAVVSGNEALVSVTGSICAPSTPCVTNSDPSLGMPPSPSQFTAYYQRAVANSTSGSTTVISPMPCSQINGKWYVAFG